ncbi:WD repeat domain phosphoinositide-interacting protein 2 isoform X2 [Chrysoperla carnea]|uniref:WD repeat domain phosphoinositide-interacting protein 2 isoform X2 n=1 Tax=Chrysoperla carnea TaxID=189513 RepID=UPI001D0807FB|nr:WD repeat domain phosphoinositide-interacting protein 2 isoform X2 [Chrysoperla carnea]
MSIPTQITDETNSGGVFFVNFNQDCSSLSVGHRNGYKIYALQSLEGTSNGLECIHEHTGEEICIVERLFSSSLVAIVSLSAPRKLRVCHFKRGTEICTYSYSNTILAVKLNRSRLVVCLEESLYIHNIRDMKVLHTIRDTPPNQLGLCALTSSSDDCLLAYPGSSTIGEVQIFDTVNLQAKTMIPAHDSPLAALGFSPSGANIATASEKGTVIRVFSVTDGTKLYEFRRGVKRCVSISSLTFSTDSQFLCCSSNTETVHIFRLEEPKDLPKQNTDEGGWMDYLSKAVSAGATYLPTQVTDVFTQGRAFAVAYLPVTGVRNVLAITTIQRVLRLLVASTDGNLYIYNLDTVEGGDLALVKTHRLNGTSQTPESEAQQQQNQNQQQHIITTPTGSDTTGGAVLSSYAGIVKGHPAGTMSDSDKLHEMAAAVDIPPKDGFRFDDEEEFPPVSQPFTF